MHFARLFVTLPKEKDDGMNHFKDLLRQRRSHRRFGKEEISGDDVQLLLRAALLSPSSMNRQSWHFIVVDDKLALEKLSDAKEHGAAFLRDAPLAIVILGNPLENDCWVEDGSIAATSMLFQAEELGLGACWIQMRNRGLSDGTMAEDVVRGILDIPEEMRVLSVIAFGHPLQRLPEHDEEQLKWENVHIGTY